jgi:hypothetical protein
MESFNYKSETSTIVINLKRWDKYVPFLCESLGLTKFEDKNTIQEIKSSEHNQWNMLEFKIQSDETYSEVTLNYMVETEKININYRRVKNEDTL